MKNAKTYEASDKMIDLIRDNYNVLQSLPAFGIRLGFGDKTVEQACSASGTDTATFLAVVNLTINGKLSHAVDELSAPALLRYLSACHRYYLDYQLPSVRRELAESLAGDNEVDRLVLRVYDEYAHEIHLHMRYEERTLFPYVEGLLRGEVKAGYSIARFAKRHAEADKSLKELKQTIIKYLPGEENSNTLISALYHIYNNEEWLANHQEVEDRLFVPLVARIEHELSDRRTEQTVAAIAGVAPREGTEAVSEREKEVIAAVVQGLSNKEIAARLFISTHTVITHRKNIARKLQIHSPAGLAIYAISNGIVQIDKQTP